MSGKKDKVTGTVKMSPATLLSRIEALVSGAVSPVHARAGKKATGRTISDLDKKKNLTRQYAQKNTKKKSKPINRINAMVGNRVSSKYIQEEAKQKNKQKKMGGGKVHMKKKKK